MEEFEPSSDAWNREGKSSSQVRGLNWEWRSSSPVRSMELEMEEFEQSSEAWNRKWESSSQVRRLESGMEEL